MERVRFLDEGSRGVQRVTETTAREMGFLRGELGSFDEEEIDLLEFWEDDR